MSQTIARTLVSLLSFTCLHTVSAATSEGCSHTFRDPHVASFDLKLLEKIGSDYYEAKDAYFASTDTKRPFSYLFAICRNVKPEHLPEICQDKEEGSAYQVIDKTDIYPQGQCMTLANADEAEWSLIDGENAGIGVKLTYSGEKCHVDRAGEKQRKFHVQFNCIAQAEDLPTFKPSVVESDCEYTIEFNTVHGCPRECHATNHEALCNGHGNCALDLPTNRARCFCNAGWAGSDCSRAPGQPANPNKTTGILFALVMTFFVVLLGLSAVVYQKIKKLNADDNPYGAFEDQGPDNPLGMDGNIQFGH